MSNEPVAKRPKTDQVTVSQTIDIYINKMTESTRNLQAVLSDDLSKPLPLIKVFVGHARDPKDLSRIIRILNEKVPLKELQHLKRVRKKDVLLCPINFLNGMSSIQEYLEFHVLELKDTFEYFKEIDVPLQPPKTKKQCNSFLWSCNFHPNKYYEKLVSDDFFTNDELKTHRIYMQMAFEVARWNLGRDNTNIAGFSSINATIIVDPVNDSVVAVSFCNIDHPIQHSAMLAIDNVAKTQYGGAWGETTSCTDCTLQGISKELLLYLRQIFPVVKFGARKYINRRNVSNSEDSSELGDNLDGPYLCTGYYVYMLKESCVMCSMALVHARAKRIFFCFDNLDAGALKSRTKLQAVSSLNHHFEVFTGFL